MKATVPASVAVLATVQYKMSATAWSPAKVEQQQGRHQ